MLYLVDNKSLPVERPTSTDTASGADPNGNPICGKQVQITCKYGRSMLLPSRPGLESGYVIRAQKPCYLTVPDSRYFSLDNSNTIVVTLVDRCVGCARDEYVLSQAHIHLILTGTRSLDLSPTAFSLLASQDLGRLSGATWHFL